MPPTQGVVSICNSTEEPLSLRGGRRPTWQSVTPSCHCEERSDVGRKGAPPVAESSDRSGWAGTCLCTNEVQGKDLVPTRKSRGSIVWLQCSVNRCQEIATAPSGPRNDRCSRCSAPGLRFPLSLRGGEADAAIRLPAGSHLPRCTALGRVCGYLHTGGHIGPPLQNQTVPEGHLNFSFFIFHSSFPR